YMSRRIRLSHKNQENYGWYCQKFYDLREEEYEIQLSLQIVRNR
ncbi:unnamed protein product, partial [marine sediment metagenome]